MGGRNYYFLVSSLTDYQFDSDAKGLKLLSLREEIASHLSQTDRDRLTELYTIYDIANIVALYNGRGGEPSELGNLEVEQVQMCVDYLRSQRPSDEDEEAAARLPKTIKEVVDRYKLSAEPNDDDDSETEPVSLERALLESYYARLESSKNSFMVEWAKFDRNLRNLCAAFSARKYSKEIATEIVGGGEIATALTTSALPDFGLKGELEYIDPIISAIESTNIIEKERKIDLIRWQMVDELTTFDYFGGGFIFGYMIKLGIIYRWISLDRDKGRELFDMMVKSLTRPELLSGSNESNE